MEPFPDLSEALMPEVPMETLMTVDPSNPVEEMKGPANEVVFAPLVIDRDEALRMAPGTIKDLSLVYRPYRMMELCFLIRADKGEDDRRSECVMVDLLDGFVARIPLSVMAELAPTAIPEEGALQEDGTILEEDRARSLAENELSARRYTIEAKVHDGPMSTIYSELEAPIVKGSTDLVAQKDISLPVWKGKLGGSTWLLDAYTGNQRRSR
jgi:hypothetical protein